ncbi:ATP-grasp domain-containing protein [Nocardia sp. NPDC023988]|uniref:ATP-grasp domain-containing protein n=1 Tax=unclassified Nocardia TaxID=2637762 RepID=UPI0033FB9638
MTATLLFCCDPLNPRKVDDHFAEQAESARAAGAPVTLLDHDALLTGDVDAAVRRVARDSGELWYRGWMIPTQRYRELAQAFSSRGCSLAVSPDQYASTHELPGWYPSFEELTPRSVWSATGPGEIPDESALAQLVAPLRDGAGIVKDYVKSRKHEWDTACFIPDLRDSENLRRVVEKFVELQGEFLAGGLVVREFEDFSDTAGSPASEARVWWLDGEPILIGPHPDNPAIHVEPDLTAIAPTVSRFGRRFITTDVARRIDGVWRVIEVGDAQVSDLPSTIDPAVLIGRLANR